MREPFFKFESDRTIISKYGLRSVQPGKAGSGTPYIEFHHENTYTRVYFETDEEMNKNYNAIVKLFGVETININENKTPPNPSPNPLSMSPFPGMEL